MAKRSVIKTSPCPLQRGIWVYCPPPEGAGGGENSYRYCEYSGIIQTKGKVKDDFCRAR